MTRYADMELLVEGEWLKPVDGPPMLTSLRSGQCAYDDEWGYWISMDWVQVSHSKLGRLFCKLGSYPVRLIHR